MTRFVRYTDTTTGEQFFCTCAPVELHCLERVNKKLADWTQGRIVAREDSETPLRYTLTDLKNEMRLHDYKGDRWACSMGCFFDLCAIAYERIDLPREWGFKPGWSGNHIEEDNFFLEWNKKFTDDELLLFGNFLFRLTNLLRATDHAY